MLTAVGTIAFQSGKYLFINELQERKASNEAFDSKIAVWDNSLLSAKTFDQIARPVKDRAMNRETFLDDSMKVDSKRLDYQRADGMLLEAHKDLGSISYASASEPLLVAERAVLVEHIKAQIEALELISRSKFIKREDLKGRIVLVQQIRNNLYRRAEAMAASQSVIAGKLADSDRLKKASEAALENFKAQGNERMYRVRSSAVVLSITSLVYAWLLWFVLPQKTTMKENLR